MCCIGKRIVLGRPLSLPPAAALNKGVLKSSNDMITTPYTSSKAPLSSSIILMQEPPPLNVMVTVTTPFSSNLFPYNSSNLDVHSSGLVKSTHCLALGLPSGKVESQLSLGNKSNIRKKTQ
ncbi:hypothetical protein SLA2020_117220 [Shorea laevis]